MEKIKQPLTLNALIESAGIFGKLEASHDEPTLYGVTDGKAVGTYVEMKFKQYLLDKYVLEVNSAAKGIDLPGLNVDIKVTSIRQPQSSCPFTSARQKIYGLGYSLLVFVYDKYDDPVARTARMQMQHVVYIDASLTADYQTTRGIAELLERDANEEDLAAFLSDRFLPVDDIGRKQLAEEIMLRPPIIGCLTISNALQWRLQYHRAISVAGTVDGVVRIR